MVGPPTPARYCTEPPVNEYHAQEEPAGRESQGPGVPWRPPTGLDRGIRLDGPRVARRSL